MCLVGGGGVIQEGGIGVPVAPPVCWTRSAVGPPRSLGWGRDAALGSEGARERAWLNQCPEDMKGSALNPQSGRGRKAPPVCAPPPPGGQGDLGAKAPAVGCSCVGETLLSGWWGGGAQRPGGSSRE